jgi:predicted extracellular nuclease
MLKTVSLFALSLTLLFGTGQAGKWIVLTVLADNTAQTIPFSQDWTNTGLITANDNWSGVAGIEAFLGQDITTATGTDPQTLLGTSAVANDLDVIANQTNTAITNGGVAEFEITNPTIALQGSGTADAPYVLLHLNTTGKSSIRVAYNLRDIDGTTDNAISPVALQYRVGSSGNFTNIAAAFVADASSGPSLATLVTPVSAILPAACDNQALVQVRIITTNAVGNDEWIGVDDISVAESTAPPTLSINDVQVTEGDAGTKTATFTVTLSAVATTNVTFDIATQDNSATSASGDYVAKSVTGASIGTGFQTYPFTVTINGDTDVESNETYFVNITNATNATILDGQGLGTITNDDVVLTAIHSIQGSATTSPLVGQSVSTRGIVTGVRTNGYYIQEPDASIDANPSTSEGIFVFTSSAPPAAAALGALVQVTGTVAEFIPSTDPLSPPVTELTSPATSQISTGNAFPTAIALTEADTPTNGTIEQLERFEGMRVTVASLLVVAPTGGSVAESSATASTNGVFYGVIPPNISRPFREAGIQANDPPPAGSGVTIPPVPRFDANPERIRVDSDGLVGGTAIEVTAGATVTNITGPVDYSFRTYTILQDPAITPGVSGNIGAVAVPAPGTRFTVASFNMQRFFDTTDEPGKSDVVLTTTAFNNRLTKVSLAIRDVLRTPYIIGCVEVENLTTLQAIAAKINSDAVTASQPNPQYQAYLVEGNDPGGIDVGFLVSTARATVVDVTQFGLTTTYTDPNTGLQATLNDRPPLVLRAVVQSQFGVNFPITVIVNHLRSLTDVDDPIDGNRIRTKRRAQAEYLANLIQARQTLDPNEKIISVGDYNAFQFNDGYVDVLGTITGAPAAANTVTLASSDLVTPNLINLIDSNVAAQRYSYVFDGNAQALDHTLITANLQSRFSLFAYGRSNADFPETYRTDPTRPERISDHDASVAYFAFPPCVLGCPGNVVANTDPGKNTAVVNYTPPSATDCGVVTCNIPSGSTFSLGPTLVTCTAATGDQCTFTVTVEDHENPVLTCPTNVARTIDGASDIVTFTPVATDNVGASTTCTPPSGSVFPLGTTPVNCVARDAANNSSSCSFNVTLTNSFVAQPSVVLSDPLECTGPGSLVTVNADIANPTAIPQTGTFQATIPAGLPTVPNSCVTNIGACAVVNATTVTWAGTIPPGQTAHIAYKTQVGDQVIPGTTLCITSTATFNGTPNSVVACNQINCPLVAPGLLPDSRSLVSDQRPGSVLVYNIHTSNAASPGAQNTRINITNTHPELSSYVHLFMVEGSSCSISDFFVCLTPSGTTSFLTSEFDPGTTGYVVAVAVNRIGCPTNFNYLIGDEYVKFSTGHTANLGAEAFSAIAGGLPLCDSTSVTAQLSFDGASYTAVPRVLAVDNIPSRAEGNDTLFILNRFGGNLGTGAATLSGLFGILYDDAEVPHSFNFSPGTCQFRSSLNNNFPKTAPRFENVIAAGKTGWIRFYSQNDQGLLGAAINFNPNTGSSAGAFSQGHNLHKLRVTNGVSIVIPVFPPGC